MSALRTGGVGTRAHTLVPTESECRALQSALCERFGGDPREPDPGLLGSLLARPRSPHYRTLSEQAAALLCGFARQPPFACHPERFAIAVTACFLHANGYRMEAAPDAVRHFVAEHVVRRRVPIDRVAAQIELAMAPV